MQRAASRMDNGNLLVRKNFEYINDLIRLKFLLFKIREVIRIKARFLPESLPAITIN